MFTVLIQSKRTMESLQQFYPILAGTIRSGRVGLCQWIESGEAAETALPELTDLVRDKRQWRAVVVCAEPEGEDALFPADAANPFDFAENRGRTGLTVEDGELVDCEAPLIRLTHMLGGVPAPDPQFEAGLLHSEEGAPRVRFSRINSQETEEQKRAAARWNAARRFRGLPPAEILLVKARLAPEDRDGFAAVDSSWRVHTEADSSTFWRRNLYPANCRFLVFDMAARGAVRQQQELFRLWTSVLLIAGSDIDPNVLQAHRLYRLDVELDGEALAGSFQQAVSRLNTARYRLEKNLARDERETAVAAAAPNYGVGVPVSFQMPGVAKMHFQAGGYGLTGGAGSGDMERWESYSLDARKELQALLQSVDRTLDQAAGRLRTECGYTEDQAVPLSRYQEEDMDLELGRVYHDILREQSELPEGISEIEGRVDEAGEKVEKLIRARMSRAQALRAGGLAFLAAAFCLLPGFFLGTARTAWIALPVCGALLALTCLLVLSRQRGRLIKAAKGFQSEFFAVVSELSHNAQLYAGFLSSVATHMQGQSYLKLMRRRRLKRSSAYRFKRRHLKAIEQFLGKLSLWSTALHAEVDLTAVDAAVQLEDGGGEIDYDSLYSLDAGKDCRAAVNQVGDTIRSPLSFVRRIEIEREEVYDDDGRTEERTD